MYKNENKTIEEWLVKTIETSKGCREWLGALSTDGREFLKEQKGEKHPRAKLTEIQVLKIREKYKKGKNIMELAKVYKLSFQHVYNLITKKSWKHI